LSYRGNCRGSHHDDHHHQTFCGNHASQALCADVLHYEITWTCGTGSDWKNLPGTAQFLSR
jgi:hypothetical protein